MQSANKFINSLAVKMCWFVFLFGMGKGWGGGGGGGGGVGGGKVVLSQSGISSWETELAFPKNHSDITAPVDWA